MDGTPSRPWHLWAVGLLSLLWNAFGGYDFIMSNVRAPSYVGALSAEAIQHLDGLPVWAIALWALGVWGAVLGSIMLVLGSRFAVQAFAASLVGLMANTAHSVARGWLSGDAIALTVAIWAVAVTLLTYALRMRRAGALK